MNKYLAVLLSAAVTLSVVGASLATAEAPTPLGSDRFEDVPEGHWADAAIGWAVDAGITSGTSDTTFTPNGTLTRAQMVTFLHRYHQQTQEHMHDDIPNHEHEHIHDDIPNHEHEHEHEHEHMHDDIPNHEHEHIHDDIPNHEHEHEHMHDDILVCVWVRRGDRVANQTYVDGFFVYARRSVR